MSDIDNLTVSIIMPAFNAEKYIGDAIQSVQNQSFKNWKLIVIDDYSSDATVSVVSNFANFDDRIELLRLYRNCGGPARPRNIGLQKATGDFIAFLDADDLWKSFKLERQVRAMSDQGLDFCAARIERFTEIFDLHTESRRKRDLELSLELLLKKNIVANSSVLMTAKLARAVCFPEAKEFIAVEDYHGWLQAHCVPDTKSVLLGDLLVGYRSSPGSISRSKIAMARKIFHLLSSFEVSGKKLGARRYLYFMSYVFGGLLGRISK